MKTKFAVCAVLIGMPLAHAADIAAGKLKVEAVCSACHGANGVSVGDAIPNLAGQKVAYLEAQLKALKDGSRKHPVMGAIAAQLSADDIANVAAYFASLPGAAEHGEVGLPAQPGEDRRHVPRQLQDHVHQVPHDQLPGHAPGALLLRQPGGAAGRQGRQAAARTARCCSPRSTRPSSTPTRSRSMGSRRLLRRRPAAVLHRDGARRRLGQGASPTCCATRTGTTPCSRSPSSCARASTRPNAWLATSRWTRSSYTFTLKELTAVASK